MPGFKGPAVDRRQMTAFLSVFRKLKLDIWKDGDPCFLVVKKDIEVDAVDNELLFFTVV